MSAVSSEPAPLPPGTMLAHYRLGEVLGAGAMGTVYRAHDTGLERGVAVKVLKDPVAAVPSAVERFFREARAAACVSHPNLTHVYFVGSEGSHRFFAMEHVPGKNLEEQVREAGPLSLEAGVDALGQAARGLAAAHAAGVIHRDVKPSNLIRRPDGLVKVTDFGLARSLDGTTDLSGAGAITGTPAYMSPEQVRGEVSDARTDVYALGLTGFYLLVGHPPFPGPALGKVLSDQMNAPLPSAVALRPDLPLALDAALARLCAKDPAHRPRDMGEVVALLEGVRPRRVERAPLAARGVAYVLDWLLIAVLWAAVQFVLSAVFGMPQQPHARWVGVGFSLLWIASQLGMELWRQASLAKHLLHLAVVREDGIAPAPRALLLRFAVRCPETVLSLATLLQWWTFGLMEALALVALAAGALCSLLTDGRTLSDRASGTTVAYRHPAPRHGDVPGSGSGGQESGRFDRGTSQP